MNFAVLATEGRDNKEPPQIEELPQPLSRKRRRIKEEDEFDEQDEQNEQKRQCEAFFETFQPPPEAPMPLPQTQIPNVAVLPGSGLSSINQPPLPQTEQMAQFQQQIQQHHEMQQQQQQHYQQKQQLEQDNQLQQFEEKEDAKTVNYASMQLVPPPPGSSNLPKIASIPSAAPIVGSNSNVFFSNQSTNPQSQLQVPQLPQFPSQLPDMNNQMQNSEIKNEANPSTVITTTASPQEVGNLVPQLPDRGLMEQSKVDSAVLEAVMDKVGPTQSVEIQEPKPVERAVRMAPVSTLGDVLSRHYDMRVVLKYKQTGAIIESHRCRYCDKLIGCVNKKGHAASHLRRCKLAPPDIDLNYTKRVLHTEPQLNECRDIYRQLHYDPSVGERVLNDERVQRLLHLLNPVIHGNLQELQFNAIQ